MNVTHPVLGRGSITDETTERFVREPHDFVYVLNATLSVPLKGVKVRVTIRRNSYDFQCAARADVLDKVHPVWNTLVTRQPTEVGAAVSYTYNEDKHFEVRDEAAELASEMVREVFDLLV